MTTQKPSTRPSPVRQRLLESASQLFYEAGIQATSADRIIADVGTTKATFYRHFATKDDLVIAYLEAAAAAEREEMQDASAPQDPQHAMAGVLHVLGAAGCEEGFRGCPFINAAAEYPDPEHPVRVAVANHRAWWVDFFRELAQRQGISAEAAPSVAGQLMMLRDGVMFGGYVDDPRGLEARLNEAVDAVLAAHRA